MDAPRDVILLGDVLDGLGSLPDGCVQTVVTSPPYWNLRDYGVPGQIGLERTLEGYIARIVAVFEEVRRVLRADGTLWLNMGDSYASDDKWGGRSGGKNLPEKTGGVHRGKRVSGLKSKDLIGLPWMVAFALRAAGWYLRCDIVWHKPNPMPESVTDRPTRAHEYLFLMSKSGRYYYDGDAIREPVRPKTLTTYGTGHRARGNDALGRVKADNWARSVAERRPRAQKVPGGWDTEPGAHGAYHRGGRGKAASVAGVWQGMSREEQTSAGAARRSVWTIAPSRYAGAHFATFAEALVEPCIAAGSKPGDLVLDPFMGSGTVAAVARRMGRSYLGCELNPAYVELAEERIAAERQPMLLYSPRRASVEWDVDGGIAG